MNGMAVDPGADAGPRRVALGSAGEEATLVRYRELGYSIVARNWRCPLGEIDLVVGRGGLLVFCEVKTRAGAAFGGGFEAVTWRKQRKLRQLAEVFLLTEDQDPAKVRFDVASVATVRGDGISVELFEDAF
jgi:putative endonuclease